MTGYLAVPEMFKDHAEMALVQKMAEKTHTVVFAFLVSIVELFDNVQLFQPCLEP